MAKHIVKCYYCGKQFDANEEEYVKVNNRRYAHKKCSEEKEQTLSQEQKDKIELEEYILKLFKVDFIPSNPWSFEWLFMIEKTLNPAEIAASGYSSCILKFGKEEYGKLLQTGASKFANA